MWSLAVVSYVINKWTFFTQSDEMSDECQENINEQDAQIY